MYTRAHWTCLALSLTLATGALIAISRGASSRAHAAFSLATAASPEGRLLERCKQLGLQARELLAERQAQDVALSEQLAALNASPTEARAERFAAVVQRLGGQQAGGSQAVSPMIESGSFPPEAR